MHSMLSELDTTVCVYERAGDERKVVKGMSMCVCVCVCNAQEDEMKVL